MTLLLSGNAWAAGFAVDLGLRGDSIPAEDELLPFGAAAMRSIAATVYLRLVNATTSAGMYDTMPSQINVRFAQGLRACASQAPATSACPGPLLAQLPQLPQR